jgi:hypothetical protein
LSIAKQTVFQMPPTKRRTRKRSAVPVTGLLTTLAEINHRHLRLTATDIIELFIALRSPGRITRLVTIAHLLARKRQEVKLQDATPAAYLASPRRKVVRRAKNALARKGD